MSAETEEVALPRIIINDKSIRFLVQVNPESAGASMDEPRTIALIQALVNLYQTMNILPIVGDELNLNDWGSFWLIKRVFCFDEMEDPLIMLDFNDNRI